MFDSMYALAKGVHSLTSSAPRSILQNISSDCESENAWMEGSSLYNYINAVQFQGLTGRVQLKEGKRSYVKWDLLKLRNKKMDKVSVEPYRIGTTGIKRHKLSRLPFPDAVCLSVDSNTRVRQKGLVISTR